MHAPGPSQWRPLLRTFCSTLMYISEYNGMWGGDSKLNTTAEIPKHNASFASPSPRYAAKAHDVQWSCVCARRALDFHHPESEPPNIQTRVIFWGKKNAEGSIPLTRPKALVINPPTLKSWFTQHSHERLNRYIKAVIFCTWPRILSQAKVLVIF